MMIDVLEHLLDVKRIPYWDRCPAISDKELDKLIKIVRTECDDIPMDWEMEMDGDE